MGCRGMSKLRSLGYGRPGYWVWYPGYWNTEGHGLGSSNIPDPQAYSSLA